MTQQQLNDALFEALSAWAADKPGMFCAKNGGSVLIIENGTVEGTCAGQAPYHYEDHASQADYPAPGYG